jgi:hypothetical protein
MSPLAPAPALRPQTRLPHYGHPPLVEVSLGLRWSMAGALDDRLRHALLDRLGPAWQLSPPAESTHSALSQSWNQPGTRFQSVLGEQRLDVNAEGFEYTWDGRQGELYPHYETVRDGFVVTLDAWCDCVTASGAAAPTYSSWKATYLNRIPQGTVWNSFTDCAFLRLLAPLPSGLPRLERLEGHWQFGLDRDDAVMSCDLKTTAGTTRDPRACLWLRLSCTGGIDGQDSSVLEGLDYGRHTIVGTFRQMMSPAANAFWELAKEQ